MLAQKDDIFEETSEEIYNLNQDDVARYWCQMREEGERILRTYKSLMKTSNFSPLPCPQKIPCHIVCLSDNILRKSDNLKQLYRIPRMRPSRQKSV